LFHIAEIVYALQAISPSARVALTHVSGFQPRRVLTE